MPTALPVSETLFFSLFPLLGVYLASIPYITTKNKPACNNGYQFYRRKKGVFKGDADRMSAVKQHNLRILKFMHEPEKFNVAHENIYNNRNRQPQTYLRCRGKKSDSALDKKGIA